MNDTPEQHIVHDIISPQGHGLMSHQHDRGGRNPIVLGPAHHGTAMPDTAMDMPQSNSRLPMMAQPLGIQQK